MLGEYGSMSITSAGPCTLPPPEKRTLEVKRTNDISDIEGARPTQRFNKFTNKPQFLQADVAGSVPKALTHGRNTRDLSLELDDIEGTRFFIKDRMYRTNRHINPLEPNYKIPTYEPTQPDSTKFVRDVLHHTDIEGSHCKPTHVYNMRDILSVNDIQGAQACWRPRHKQARLDGAPCDILDVQDISARTHRHVDKVVRCTDVMNPKYQMHGIEIADDHRSRPAVPKSYIADNHLLQTRDIVGATPGHKSNVTDRREFKNTNVTMDISGAQADTIKHSIITNRITNPLTPTYQGLDCGEALPPVLTPLLPASLVTVPTMRPPKESKSMTSGKPPLDKQTLSLGGGYGASNTFSSTAPALAPGNTTGNGGGSGSSSARANFVSASVNNVLGSYDRPQSYPTPPLGSSSPWGQSSQSPSSTSRGRSGGGGAAADKRAALQLSAEIDAVRQLM